MVLKCSLCKVNNFSDKRQERPSAAPGCGNTEMSDGSGPGTLYFEADFFFFFFKFSFFLLW